MSGTKRFSFAPAANIPPAPIATPLGVVSFEYENLGLDLIMDEVWIMVSPQTTGVVVDPNSFGVRFRIGEEGKIEIPTFDDLPAHFEETDQANAWIHPTGNYVQILNRPLRLQNGDTLWQEFYNLHEFNVTVNFVLKGHYESV